MARHTAPADAPARSAWWRWRHTRPFWGGLLVTLAGAEILLTVKAPLPIIVHVGMQGVAGFLVPMILLLCGLLLLVHPDQRLFYSLVAAGLTLASWITSNLGGFLVGIVLGLVGSALAFAWSPHKESPGSAPDSAAPGRRSASEWDEQGRRPSSDAVEEEGRPAPPPPVDG
jgi:hypothetical protein